MPPGGHFLHQTKFVFLYPIVNSKDEETATGKIVVGNTFIPLSSNEKTKKCQDRSPRSHHQLLPKKVDNSVLEGGSSFNYLVPLVVILAIICFICLGVAISTVYIMKNPSSRQARLNNDSTDDRSDSINNRTFII